MAQKKGKGGATVDDMLRRSLGRHVGTKTAVASATSASEPIDEDNLPLWKKIANQRPVPTPVVEAAVAEPVKQVIKRAGGEVGKRADKLYPPKSASVNATLLRPADVQRPTSDDSVNVFKGPSQLPLERLTIVKALASLHKRLGSERFAKYMILRELQGSDESLRMSQKELQNLLGFSRQGVRKFLACLKDDGCLGVVTPANPETSQSTVYRVLAPIDAVETGGALRMPGNHSDQGTWSDPG